MNEHFLSYEQSLAVKELGFDEPCIAVIDQIQFLYIKGTKRPPRGAMVYDEINCPLKSQFFKWVRNNNTIYPTLFQVRGWSTVFKIIEWDFRCDSTRIIDSTPFEEFEQAENECINKIIEILKSKQ